MLDNPLHARGLETVKLVLRAGAVVILGYFTASHWLFHRSFFNALGIHEPALDSLYVISQLQLIGALTFGYALILFTIASDPMRYRAILQVVLLVGVICVAIFVGSVMLGRLPVQFLVNAALLGALVILTTLLYPWRSAWNPPQ